MMTRPFPFFLCLWFLGALAPAGGQASNAKAVLKLDGALDAIVPAGAILEKLNAEGFEGGEGPVWVQEGKSGYLLFSDIPGNRVYRWMAGKLSVFLEHAGSAGSKSTRANAGTNGLTLDRQHRLVVDATGDRAVERI